MGARCAGAATALLLAQQGLKVLAIDRQPEGSDTLSTHALMRIGVFLLQRWGVLSDLLSAGTPLIRRTTFHFGEHKLDVPIKRSHGVDALVAPRRTRLDWLLVEHARAAGAEIRFGVTLVAPVRSNAGRGIGATTQQPDGTRAEVRCGLLVGVDGLRSAVAEAVQAPTLWEAQHSSSLIYGFWKGLEQGGYHWHYALDASVGVVPTDDGQTCVFAVTSDSRMNGPLGQDAMSAYKQLLDEAAPGFGRAPSTPCRAPPPRLLGSQGLHALGSWPGLGAVGDAGYFKDRLTSHGISDAFRDAELLAAAMVEGTEAALARYRAERDAPSTDLFRVADEIASFAWDLDAIQRHLERLSAAMKTELASLATRAPGAAAVRLSSYAA